MARPSKWGLRLLVIGLCGAGIFSATLAAAQGQPANVPPNTLVVTSDPPGATVTLWVDETDVFRIKAGDEFKNTGIRGTTPWQVNLKNNKMARYFIEYIKDGYEPITKQVDIEEAAVEGVSKERKAAAAVLGLAGQAAGIFSKDARVQDGIGMGSRAMETDYTGGGVQLQFSPNPVHVVLKRLTPGPAASAPGAAPADTTLAKVPAEKTPAKAPVPGQPQGAQAFVISCLFRSLVLDDKIVLAESQRPVTAKFGPVGEFLVMEGDPKKLRCEALLNDLIQKGMRVCFSKGLLYLGEFVFSFEDGAYIVYRDSGQLVGCGISIVDDEDDGKHKARKSKREQRKSKASGKTRAGKVEVVPSGEEDD